MIVGSVLSQSFNQINNAFDAFGGANQRVFQNADSFEQMLFQTVTDKTGISRGRRHQQQLCAAVPAKLMPQGIGSETALTMNHTGVIVIETATATRKNQTMSRAKVTPAARVRGWRYHDRNTGI